MSSAPKLLAKVMVFNSIELNSTVAFFIKAKTAAVFAFTLTISASVSTGDVAGLAAAGFIIETSPDI